MLLFVLTLCSAWADRDEAQTETTAHIITVLGCIAPNMTAKDCKTLQGQLMKKLKAFALPAGLIAPALHATMTVPNASVVVC